MEKEENIFDDFESKYLKTKKEIDSYYFLLFC